MTIKYGYKVVKIEDGKLVSAVGGLKYPSNIEYKVGEFVKRRHLKYGPLAVFTDLESVLNWNGYDDRDKQQLLIYECEYIPSKQRFLRGELHNNKMNTEYEGMLPDGCDFANAVKLIKEVKQCPEDTN